MPESRLKVSTCSRSTEISDEPQLFLTRDQKLCRRCAPLIQSVRDADCREIVGIDGHRRTACLRFAKLKLQRVGNVNRRERAETL